ncbi:unnamed protein product [Notodromas monacha]|uniref:Methyltransferase-like protein 23 n=1 Tax=Notodromas monacha TaxID=399045 RepID=A0A7R9BVQ5_9CRUS|nr:unnamed protein product [Notodromas monacha]CAG0921475.1 unnamed protein product [Notodromas monacha]
MLAGKADELKPQKELKSLKIPRKFVFRNGDGFTAELHVNEIMHPDFGMYTWPCSVILSQYIIHNRRDFSGKRVLELGAGTGLSGLVALKCGAQAVTFTDRDSVALENVESSAKENCLEESSFTVKTLNWGVISPGLLRDFEGFDFILGADCFFDQTVFLKLIVTVAYLLVQNPSAVFITSYQVRSADWQIVDLLTHWKLKCEAIPLTDFGGDKESLGETDIIGTQQFQLLIISPA